tara:strand:+ start:190 stop:393 length:204 start_codon:yes stop_codon:yes gene_type:complete
MTPVEKAYDIWQKMMNADVLVDETSALQCALVAIDELINDNNHNENIVNAGLNKQYWIEVKEQIEKL